MEVSEILQLQKEISQEIKSPPEVEAIIEAIDIEQQFSAFENRAGKTLRAQHPKQHGLVKAIFKVNKDLPSELRIGVFQPSSIYQAQIRFSSASPSVTPDSYPGQLGIAVKLENVDGKNLVDGKNEQDFLLVSYPFFILKDMLELADAMKALAGGAATTEAFFKKHPEVYQRVQEQKGYYKNPLEVQYYSMTPYQFGNKKVKYSINPQKSPNSGSYKKGDIPVNSSASYLQEAMENTLDRGSVSFDFLVQFFKNEKETPIEDPTVIWKTAFIKVATITIPQQYFTSEGQLNTGQNLSFNPWNGLVEHTPIGSINQGRKFIYQNLFSFRTQRNQIAPNSPKQHALNLVLKIRETPVTVKSMSGEVIVQTQDIADNYKTLRAALSGGGTGLDSIKTIHFARNLFFDPVYQKNPDGFEEVAYYKTVTLLTAYDEGFADYIIDFAEAIYERFNFLLSFVQGTESIQDENGNVKVQKNIQNFVRFIGQYNQQEVAFYSSYPNLSVVQILQNAKRRDSDLIGSSRCPMGF